MKYKIVLDKEMMSLIINKPDMDDSDKYTVEANGIQSSAYLTVEGLLYWNNLYNKKISINKCFMS